MWKKLEEVDIKNKEKYLEFFKNLIKQIEADKYDFKDKGGDDYKIINEKKHNENFVHIVPKELTNLFNEMKEKTPDEFLGFTILINKTRVSCFGIPCHILSKAIIDK
ncbi:hypothetical protein BMS3Abin17_00296 [archaeon BMS3Abin17]|nr:hypothetical protein BMS3Abin17_00296 [archaeon BMS3Abin17]HDZ60375.1 hypothetical protein [Candidatus Pacearchaeota archaeon]